MPIKDPEARRKYAREWVAKRRAEWLADKACVICGSTDRLEIDHVDRNTKVNHRIWSWSKTRRDEELAKCQVLCYEHHLEKTVRESKGVQVPHGDDTRYTKWKCRCAPCTEAHRVKKEEWRAQRRAAGLSVS